MWYSRDGVTHNQIDYVIATWRFKSVAIQAGVEQFWEWISTAITTWLFNIYDDNEGEIEEKLAESRRRLKFNFEKLKRPASTRLHKYKYKLHV